MANSVSNGKHKINFLDFLLIVLIVAMLSAAIVSVIRSNPNKISGYDKEITYKITCEMVDSSVNGKIQVGDNIYDNVSNQLLGMVTLVEISNVTAIDDTSSGGSKVDTGKVLLTLTVKAGVWEDGDVYYIDSYRISAGKTIDFHSENLSLSGLCTQLNAQ